MKAIKARKAHPQREIQTSHQHYISPEEACSLVRQARLGVRTARALLRGTQPTVKHLHALLRNRELNKHAAAQLSRETERLAGVTQRLATLTHAFTNAVQNFLLEVTLKQDQNLPRITPSAPRPPSVDDHRKEIS